VLSLVIYLALIGALLLTLANALVWSARVVGSSNARFWTGVWLAIGLLALNVAFGVGSAFIPTEEAGLAIGIGIGLLLLQLFIVLLVAGRVFRLSIARAFAPLGAYIGVNVIWVALVMLAIQPLATEPFVIPDQSMAPTLKRGDRFFVNRLLAPRRWDLVAYETIDDDPVIFCKRLVGLPGEKLRFEDGELYVNDEIQTAPDPVAGRYSASYSDAPDLSKYRDGQLIWLGNDELFFVGDNVNRSRDSRSDGPTNKSKLIGVADLRYWPFGRIAILR
jgi:signal peptidase I